MWQQCRRGALLGFGVLGYSYAKVSSVWKSEQFDKLNRISVKKPPFMDSSPAPPGYDRTFAFIFQFQDGHLDESVSLMESQITGTFDIGHAAAEFFRTISLESLVHIVESPSVIDISGVPSSRSVIVMNRGNALQVLDIQFFKIGSVLYTLAHKTTWTQPIRSPHDILALHELRKKQVVDDIISSLYITQKSASS